MPSNNHMSKSDASRVQSTQAKGGNDMSSGGFAARAQSAGDRNTLDSASGNASGNSGGYRGASGGGDQGFGSSGGSEAEWHSGGGEGAGW